MNEISSIAKIFAKKIAKVKDAFILEELKPYYNYKDGDIIFNQKVNLRLAEIKDYQNTVKRTIDELIEYWIQQDYCIVGSIKTHYKDILQLLRYRLFGEYYRRK